MPRDEIPVVEVDSCDRCPMRGRTRDHHRPQCQLTGAEINYHTIPRGCPLRGGPVQVKLSFNARAFIEEHEK